MNASAAVANIETPMAKVVKLIVKLRASVLKDGKDEQKSYDKYACFCEDTMERKASAISKAKELIEKLSILIKKLNGEIASHGSEIAQLKKDISDNNGATKEATELRGKEYKEYAAARAEAEQCIGALEAATKVLTGAGTKKAAG